MDLAHHSVNLLLILAGFLIFGPQPNVFRVLLPSLPELFKLFNELLILSFKFLVLLCQQAALLCLGFNLGLKPLSVSFALGKSLFVVISFCQLAMSLL